MSPLCPEPSASGSDRARAAEDRWEAAYLRFETPEEETRKFVRRLRQLGTDRWSREVAIVELFCGRGNGMRALGRLGFGRVTGVDLSPALAARSPNRGKVIVGDCRRLPYASGSRDVATVHGGLHHLPRLPEDLEETLAEVRRVLRADGLLLIVEPWKTPFLDFTHMVARQPWARGLSDKVDALGRMVELEGETYQRWLASPQQVLAALERHFHVEVCRRRWGKLLFLGRRRAG